MEWKDLQEQANELCSRYSQETVKHSHQNHKIDGIFEITETVEDLSK